MSIPINIKDDTHKRIIELLQKGWVSRQEICQILGNVTPCTCTNHVNAISLNYTVSERHGVWGVEYKILTQKDFEMYEQKRRLKMELGIKDKAVPGTAKNKQGRSQK